MLIIMGHINMCNEGYPLDESGREPLPACLSHYTGFLIAKAHQHLLTRFSEACLEIGLEPSHAGILVLLNAQGGMSQQQLSRSLRIDRTSMVKLVDSLEEKKHARRKDHPDDRRMYLVDITPAGKKALTALLKLAERMEESLLADFTEDERSIVRRALINLAG